MKSSIEVQAAEMVSNTKKGQLHPLRDIKLVVQCGEFVTLIGHSGCCKSTWLKLIAGLARPTAGVLLCDDREIAEPGPERAVVFQNHSLLPWMTCFENVLLSDRIVMMTNGPAVTIGEILSVDIDRPRQRVQLVEDPRYIACRKAVIDFLYTRHARVDKAA